MPGGHLLDQLSGVRCTAHSKRHKGQCKSWAIRGLTVCYMHGGATKASRRKAQERIADLIDPDRTLREAARLAFSDIRELYTKDGKLKPMHEWPDHIAAAVGGVEVMKRNEVAGDGQQEQVIKIKLWDKPKNIEFLLKHLGLLEERIRLDVTGFENRLLEARKRLARHDALLAPSAPMLPAAAPPE